MGQEPLATVQQPHQPQFQPKLAPWAKMSEGNTGYNGNQSSGLSLTEIQKLEEEREREAKMRREMQEAAQARARQEEEARRPQVYLVSKQVLNRNLAKQTENVTKGEKNRESLFTFPLSNADLPSI